MIALLLALAADAPATPAAGAQEAACLAKARTDPGEAERMARGWMMSGGVAARRCLAMALTEQDRYPEAADAFADVARAAELAHDPAAAQAWAQSGNAWLAAGQPEKARAALDAALAAGTLTGLQRGEANLDRARALVAANRPANARADLDQALANAPEDPLAWLLSATLARRTGDVARAKTDIAQALRRSPDDASVRLEAGNIAALSGDEAGAQAAWREAARLAPDAPAGRSAAQALTQFAATESPK